MFQFYFRISFLLIYQLFIFFTISIFLTIGQLTDQIDENDSETEMINSSIGYQHKAGRSCDTFLCPQKDYGPLSPYIPCDHLPMDFIECDDLIDHQGNITSYNQSGRMGCLRFQGGQQGIYFGASLCHVLTFIECYGNRTFIREGLPCVRYNGHFFLTALLFSLLLGYLGMDRFYLGHIGTAIGKLLTIGGMGIWWLVDIILLVTGNLVPEDGSNWMPYV